jgi:hypothetical protein
MNSPTGNRSVMHLFKIALTLVALGAPLEAQSAPLTVKRIDGTEVVVTAAQLSALPRVSGAASAHGNTFTYEGTDLRSVLRAAGVAPLDSLRGPLLRRAVVFVGADGYGAVIALSDLDPSIGGRRAILVDREDGAALPPNRAPRRIIIEGDHRPSRWVHQVVRIEIVDVR